MDDSFGAGGFNANATTAGAGNETQKEGILPCCIRQLLLVEDDVKMFNFSYAMVNIVVIVRKIDYTSTKITYTIEDHTGRMEAHYWLDEENSQQPKVTQNAYARIIGSLRKVGDTNVVIIYQAEEVEKVNDLTTHLLEVLFCRFKAEQFSKGGVAPTRAISTGVGEAVTFDHGGGGGGNAPVPMDTGASFAGLTGKNGLITEAIKMGNDMNNDSGINKQQLFSKFPKIPRQEVEQILDYLINEGFIYSTINGDHFKTVE